MVLYYQCDRNRRRVDKGRSFSKLAGVTPSFMKSQIRCLSWCLIVNCLAAIPVVAVGEESHDADVVDLSRFYGKISGTEGDSWFEHPDWAPVPKGLQEFDGIVFDVAGTMLLRSHKMPHLKAKQGDIPIDQTARFIHVLHGIGYADPEGTTVAALNILYSDGSEHRFPIIYGAHVRNWWKQPTETNEWLSHNRSAVAWSGRHPVIPRYGLRLYRTSFENPHEGKEIKSIHFESEMADSVLCIVAVSVGDRAPKPVETPHPLPGPLESDPSDGAPADALE